MLNKSFKAFLAIAILFLGLGLAGCSGVSDEQIAELESLRSEVKSLNDEVNSLKDQKASLEKEIAEKNSKLDECAKLKAETQKNLEKMGQ